LKCRIIIEVDFGKKIDVKKFIEQNKELLTLKWPNDELKKLRKGQDTILMKGNEKKAVSSQTLIQITKR